MSEPQKPRSSSCSRISKIPTRPSIQKSRALNLNKPSEEKKSLGKNFSRSSSNLLELPRFSRQRSGSLTRQPYCTPLKQCGIGQKSPMSNSVRKDNRPIFDKTWQYSEIVKVRKFVVDNFGQLDYNSIKPGISLDMFVKLMNQYAQLIDKRIVIKSDNYVEEVPSFLKRYRYTVNIKPSLMKTVNVPHNWPHVLAILSWLTDTISKLQVNENEDLFKGMAKLVDKCILSSYLEFNEHGEIKKALHEFETELDQFLNINDDDLEALDKELACLKEQESILKRKNEELEKKKKELADQIKTITDSCNGYITSTTSYKQILKDQIDNYDKNILKLEQEIPELLKQQDHLKHIVHNQKCTVAEKAQLEREIDELKNTITLTTQRHEEQQQLLSSYDFQLSDIKQQFERKVYKYNNIVSELKLVNPEFNQLHIRESGFARMDMEEEIQHSEEVLKKIYRKLEENQDELDIKIAEAVKKNEELNKKLQVTKKELEDQIKTDAELGYNIAQANKKHESEKGKHIKSIEEARKQLEQVKQNQINLKPYEDELKMLNERNIKLAEMKNTLKQRASHFFPKLTKQIIGNFKNYMETMESTSKGFEEATMHASDESKYRTRLLKTNREELEKTEKCDDNSSSS